MKMHSTLAIAAVASLVHVAAAAVVPTRFSATSEVTFEGEVLDLATASRNDLGLAVANLDSGSDVGTVRTALTATDASLTIASDMGVSSEFNGKSSGTGRYEFDADTNVNVSWNWTELALQGGWKIMNAQGATVASLTFLAGQLTSTGGDFGTSQVGVGDVTLGAGQYTFVANYEGDTMPSASSVVFTFTAVPIPAPGAIALLGAAGLVGSFRRRA
jgi:hypothetical protein